MSGALPPTGGEGPVTRSRGGVSGATPPLSIAVPVPASRALHTSDADSTAVVESVNEEGTEEKDNVDPDDSDIDSEPAVDDEEETLL
jgi:hypothetical protein